jgi:ribosomal protein S18 acetylase RimI-like enzyme
MRRIEMMANNTRPARLEDVPALAHVHIESWRTTYKGIVPDEFLAALSYERRMEQWKTRLTSSDPRVFVYVAVDEQDCVVGFVNGGKPQQADEYEYSGELYAIYLLKEYQGRGLGRMLVQRLVERMVQAEMHTMFLWVFKDNPARSFYEILDGKLIRKQPITIAGVALEEVAYGWQDIQSILRQ